MVPARKYEHDAVTKKKTEGTPILNVLRLPSPRTCSLVNCDLLSEALLTLRHTSLCVVAARNEHTQHDEEAESFQGNPERIECAGFEKSCGRSERSPKTAKATATKMKSFQK